MTHNAHDPYLFETPHGSVLHCACCGRVQIVFDGLTLLVQRLCFEELRREVAQAVGAVRRARMRAGFGSWCPRMEGEWPCRCPLRRSLRWRTARWGRCDARSRSPAAPGVGAGRPARVTPAALLLPDISSPLPCRHPMTSGNTAPGPVAQSGTSHSASRHRAPSQADLRRAVGHHQRTIQALEGASPGDLSPNVAKKLPRWLLRDLRRLEIELQTPCPSSSHTSADVHSSS